MKKMLGKPHGSLRVWKAFQNGVEKISHLTFTQVRSQ